MCFLCHKVGLLWAAYCRLLFFIQSATLFLFFFIYLCIYLYIFGCVGSSVRARAFSSCGKQGPLFIAVRGPLTIAAPPVVGHRLQTRRLSSCGSRAQPLHSMWDPPRPGLEPVSPALAGRLSTTAPPGKPPGLGLDISGWPFFSLLSPESIKKKNVDLHKIKSMKLNMG